MPQTRDQRCISVLKNFFESPEILDNKYYELKKITHRGWKTARYEIKIPNTWTSDTPEYDERSHQLIWKRIGRYQEIPSRNEITRIRELFKAKFEPHEKSIIVGSKGRKRDTSYLRIYQDTMDSEIYDSDDDDGVRDLSTINIRVVVQYNKDEIPFPEDFNFEERTRKLERENNSLRDTIKVFRHQTDRYINRLRRTNMRLLHQRDEANTALDTCYVSFQQHNGKYMQKYRDIINKQYEEQNKHFDCPICYENIEKGNIFTTPCNHVLCNTCAKQCENCCPLCREEMFNIESIL